VFSSHLNTRKRLVCGLFLLFFSAQIAAVERPNIVLIMADDVGYGDVSFYNEHVVGKKAHVHTPNIDALAAQGIWFTDAHSPSALCSTTRYSVMSGNSTYRSYAPWGVWGSFKKNAITKDDLTLGRVAKAAGYETGFVGKWHLGGSFHKKGTTTIYEGKNKGEATKIPNLKEWIAGHPRELGFDYDFTVPTGVQGPLYLAFENSHWYPLSEKSDLLYMEKNNAEHTKIVGLQGPGMGDPAWDATRLNKLLASKAEQFIHSNAGKTPFLLTYWSSAVHVPHLPPEKWGKETIAGTTLTRHLDMVKTLDQEVSTIVKALKATGVYENTLIVFTSDNGGIIDSTAEAAGHNSPGDLRGSKGQAYEGGHRVPFIVTWPAYTAQGSQNDALVNGTDLVATIAALLAVPVKPEQAKDSWNLLPLIKGEKDAPRRYELMLQGGVGKKHVVFRDGHWKLLIRSGNRVKRYRALALFDLSSNPQEEELGNLVENPKYQDRVKKMLKRYIKIRQSGIRTAPLNDSVPGKNKAL
jgi:arylsulfatase A